MNDYPHTLTVLSETPIVQDANGDWVVSGDASEPEEYECRFSANDSNGYLPGIDGTKIDFKWIVYLPIGIPELPTGANVQGNKNGKIITDKVLRFEQGFFNTRIWL